MDEPPHRHLLVSSFLEDERLNPLFTCHAGKEGLVVRRIEHPRIQKNGLAFVGHFDGVVPTRIQVIGRTELSYLNSLSPEKKKLSLKNYFSLGLSCVILTTTLTPSADFIDLAENSLTPLISTLNSSSQAINLAHDVLDEKLAPTTLIHGVLLDVFGVGVLLIGESGIGKSECALELVLRRHRLVADDVVLCDFRPPSKVYGVAPTPLKNHIEIRGLGILNVKDMFGVTAVRPRKRIEIVVSLVPWKEGTLMDRIHLDEHFYTLLGVKMRHLTLPVQSGRDMASLVEIAARDELLRRTGRHGTEDFLREIKKHMDTKKC